VKSLKPGPTKFNGCAPSLQTTLTTRGDNVWQVADAGDDLVVFVAKASSRTAERPPEIINDLQCGFVVSSRGVTMQAALSKRSRRAASMPDCSEPAIGCEPTKRLPLQRIR